MANTFELSVITPEKGVLETVAVSVTIPAYDGELGVLAHRAPLLVKLGAGWMRIETAEGQKLRLLVSGGFAQMGDNKLAVLTEQAKAPEELDTARARAAMEAAEAMVVTDDASFEARARALRFAKEMAKAAGE
ncbi:MAG TPA: ATP synthase F1 subunit epsilon [Thermoanaerobaculia bacterium]|nr:ATP synthase F1 subunit epsilon [Thermoanaerobaculia bacterium]